MTAIRKKLIEVALPLAAINEASASEKSVPRRGHPQTIHLWWARRPLAACRAVLFAQLVDDPSAWPDMFPTTGAQEAERQRLFGVLQELVVWENSRDERVIGAARLEIARSLARGRKAGRWSDARDEAVLRIRVEPHIGLARSDMDAVNRLLAEVAPPVYDPFAGGGSIPLEAQRLGLRAIASDLNPVAVLINKALLEIPSRFAGHAPVNPDSRKEQGFVARTWQGASGLAEDVRYYGAWIQTEAVRRLRHLYPPLHVTPQLAKQHERLQPYIGKELEVLAWFWARTVASPNPACRGAHVPLVSTFWLSKRPGKETWLDLAVDTKKATWRVEVKTGTPPDPKAVESGTKRGRGDFRCAISGAPIPGAYIREEAKAGRLRTALTAMVVDAGGQKVYVSPTPDAAQAADVAVPDDAPDTDLPDQALGFRVQAYGIVKHRDLFSPRQLTAILTLSALTKEARALVLERLSRQPASSERDEDNATRYADAVQTYLGLGVGRTSDYNSTICTWNIIGGSLRSTFARHALQMTWDYFETNPLLDTTGSWSSCLSWVADVLDALPANMPATVERGDASDLDRRRTAVVISTDPPYYDNIGYADLSDFFYVWLRASLRDRHPDLFNTVLVPKSQELIATPYRFGGDRQRAKAFFETGLRRAFSGALDSQLDEYPLSVYYAFKQTESSDTQEPESEEAGVSSTGWETMLAGLVDSGFVVEGTWPIRTERSGRTIGLGTNALASSIVLVCRKRPRNAETTTRADFRRLLRAELPAALRALQHGNIAPVDMAQASIGPGIAIFSRHAKVLEADGQPMTVRTALQLINQALDEYLTEQEGEFDGDTRFALTWFETRQYEAGPFGEAETLAKARNVSVSGVAEAGILSSAAGKVRLRRRDELDGDWNPETDKRLTVWEAAQHLIKRLEAKGEQSAADLLTHLRAKASPARDLAYRLYTTCERKGWAEEARSYNGLVVAWPELEKLSANARTTSTTQENLF